MRMRSREAALEARVETSERELRARLDVPLAHATTITSRTLALFPVRVWRHFLQHNGFLLAAGVSYQALFALFAALYIVFAVVGLQLGVNSHAVTWLIGVINSGLPGLIGEDGVIQPNDVYDVVSSSTGALTLTGIIAVGALLWTASGWLTFSRRAVCDILGLPGDTRNFLLLKVRDLLAALAFGAAMIAGGLVNNAGTWALTSFFNLLHVSTSSIWFRIAVGAVAVIVSYVINSLALDVLYRFLAGVALERRRILPGALLGGAGVTVLQLGLGLLAYYSPSNPLLATFAVAAGLLVWFRLTAIVTLVAAAWIGVSAADAQVPLRQPTAQQRLRDERTAAMRAALAQLEAARAVREHAPWYRRFAADRAVRRAEAELLHVAADLP
jgi:membrane protein